MKEEIMQKLTAVLGALNSISVNGRQNLVSLSGSMAVVEEILVTLNGKNIEIIEKEDD